jgi:hypothetical protein
VLKIRHPQKIEKLENRCTYAKFHIQFHQRENIQGDCAKHSFERNDSLFIDDMTVVLEFSKYHMYADDLQIYHSRPREMLLKCICKVNSDLSKVFEWSLANSLKLNPLKSMMLRIYRNHLLGPPPALFLSDDFIPY